MIAIIDYGVGNLFSLQSSFAAIGREARVVSDPEELKNSGSLILPGVGAFRDAAEKLQRSGMDDAVREEAAHRGERVAREFVRERVDVLVQIERAAPREHAAQAQRGHAKLLAAHRRGRLARRRSRERGVERGKIGGLLRQADNLAGGERDG